MKNSIEKLSDENSEKKSKVKMNESVEINNDEVEKLIENDFIFIVGICLFGTGDWGNRW